MIVAFLNQKGGVGKTTLALHLAGEWARHGQRITLIESDLFARVPGVYDLIVCNPPYGVRLSDTAELEAFYPKLGDALKAVVG